MDDRIDAVQRMQDYIRCHLNEEITLDQLSLEAHFSPWYSARIFKDCTGLSPGEYIRRLKLSTAALRLRDEQVRVIDIAYDFGFISVDGFQRAFQKEYGCNPKAFARNPIPLPLFIPYGVKFSQPKKKEVSSMENIKNVFIQVIEKPERSVIIKRGTKARGYFEYCQEVGCDVWGILTSIKSLIDEPVCLWLPPSYCPPNTSTYVQGVEIEATSEPVIPDGFERIELPAAKYLMFQGEPFEEEDYCEAIEALQDSMNQYDPSIIGFQWDDSNPRIQLEPIGARGYIELRAIVAFHPKK